jgi:hypothetical protein
MDITLQLSQSLAEAAAGEALQATELGVLLARHGVALKPLDASRSGPLARYFVVSVTRAADAELLRGELSRLPGVEAAYIKPEVAPP